MPTAPGKKLGPTGNRVADNVKSLRGRVPVREFSQRMRMVGRPVLPSGITAIEQGSRRVDVDDLVALAVALDVTPNRLLLTETAVMPPPNTPARETVELVPGQPWDRFPTGSVWKWANGEHPLPNRFAHGLGGTPVPAALEHERRWYRNARPYDTSPTDTLPALEPHRAALDAIAAQVDALGAEGLSRESVINYLRWSQPRAQGAV